MELIGSVANYCEINMCPFNCVGDSVLINVSQILLDIDARYGRLLVEKVRAEYILPCANTGKRRIQSLASIIRSEVITRLAAVDALGELEFSLDLWIDRYKRQAYSDINGTFLCCKAYPFYIHRYDGDFH